jgi:hypothetical protein
MDIDTAPFSIMADVSRVFVDMWATAAATATAAAAAAIVVD